MRAITTCDSCHGDITAEDVHATLPIRRSPQYTALVFNCPLCGQAGRMACPVREWEVLVEELNKVDHTLERAMWAGRLELDHVDDVGDLLALWASYGPPIMEVSKPCWCVSCENRRKLNGTER